MVDMTRQIQLSEISAWLEQQILVTQIEWMDYYESGKDELRRQQEAVLDGIYAFREYFLEIPVPAPGQGYEPPAEIWAGVVRDRAVMAIDSQISDLVAQREQILNS